MSFALVNPQAQAQSCNDEDVCIDTGTWRFGVALGVGARTNPLVDGDVIPLVVLPDIAWYGKSWYWDNDEVGYEWLNREEWSAEFFVMPNRERAFFSFFQPANILLPSNTLAPGSGGSQLPGAPPPEPVSIDDVADREWAFDAGVRVHKRMGSQEWSFSATTDVSGVHQGQQAILAYSIGKVIGGWRWNINPSLVWKSANLTDYYYGIDERDNVPEDRFFSAGAGWQPHLTISGSKPLRETNWVWLTRFNYQYLHQGMRDSPLVDEPHSISVFFGLGYQFK